MKFINKISLLLPNEGKTNTHTYVYEYIYIHIYLYNLKQLPN